MRIRRRLWFHVKCRRDGGNTDAAESADSELPSKSNNGKIACRYNRTQSVLEILESGTGQLTSPETTTMCVPSFEQVNIFKLDRKHDGHFSRDRSGSASPAAEASHDHLICHLSIFPIESQPYHIPTTPRCDANCPNRSN